VARFKSNRRRTRAPRRGGWRPTPPSCRSYYAKLTDASFAFNAMWNSIAEWSSRVRSRLTQLGHRANLPMACLSVHALDNFVIRLRTSTRREARCMGVESMSRFKPKNISECRVGRIADAWSMEMQRGNRRWQQRCLCREGERDHEMRDRRRRISDH
jgi:hypothetical protein